MTHSTVRKYAAVLSLSLFLLPTLGQAETERQHGAHVHGLANLNIAIEGNDIHADLESPAVNIIGFEHSPQNEEELHNAQKAVVQMEKGDELFLFSSAAKCKLVEAKVDSSMELAIKHDEDEEHDDHDEDHDAHHHGHSDIDAVYHFSCENPEKLNQLEVKFFDLFHGFQKVKVQILGKGRQAGAELTPENISVTF